MSFQDYEVLNLLGKGGFATVYRARCLKTGIEVAVKMVSRDMEVFSQLSFHQFYWIYWVKIQIE